MSIESLELTLESMADQVKNNLCTRESFVKSKELENTLGFKSSEIRACVRYLRNNGEPIVSSVKGYKYSHCPAEILKTVSHLKSRSFSMLNTAKAMNSYVENQYQISLSI